MHGPDAARIMRDELQFRGAIIGMYVCMYVCIYVGCKYDLHVLMYLYTSLLCY